MKITLIALFALALMSCSASTVQTEPGKLGIEREATAMYEAIEQSTKVKFSKHTAADWQVNLSGLVNLKHPKAIAAGLKDRMEPIQIYTYVIEHPTEGTFIIDSGISESFRDIESNQDISLLVKFAMNTDALKVHKTTKELDSAFGGIDGVFLTHIHMDHIMGLKDLGPEVPVYIGPGDTRMTDVTHAATRSTTDNLLANVTHLIEWQYEGSGIIDVFDDGSFWAIHSPGHTPGATAYLAMTEDGPQLLLGDVTHTRWGWENGVEPGTFSADIERSVRSLKFLLDLAQKFPDVNVHPGHQSL